MIFVTVGAQMPFDRLIRAVDLWAAHSGRDDVFAQIGEGGWLPEHIDWATKLAPIEFRERMKEADIIVAHAGTGSILSATSISFSLSHRVASLIERKHSPGTSLA